jgi:hypothetical protein
VGFTAAVLHGPRRQPLHASRGSRHRPTMPTDEEAALRDRLAKLAAEFRHAGREAVAWQDGELHHARANGVQSALTSYLHIP